MTERTPPADWRTYTPHPAASMWPMASRTEYDDLEASIAATGLAVPILKKGPIIIDGRNRLQACRKLNIEPRFEEYQGADDEIVMEIWKRNFARRQLTSAQKAQMLVKLKTQAPGVWKRWEHDKREAEVRRRANLKQIAQKLDAHMARRRPGKPSGRTTARIAHETGLPKTAVERAERVQRKHPESVDAIIAGEVSPKAVLAHGGAEKAKAAKAAGQRVATSAGPKGTKGTKTTTPDGTSLETRPVVRSHSEAKILLDEAPRPIQLLLEKMRSAIYDVLPPMTIPTGHPTRRVVAAYLDWLATQVRSGAGTLGYLPLGTGDRHDRPSR